MKTFFNKKERGFTLIELLVVISIIGLLSSVVLASLGSAKDKASVAAGLYFADNLYHTLGSDAIAIYNFEDSTASNIIDSSGNGYDLAIAGYNAINLSNSTPSNKGKSLNIDNGSMTYWNTLGQSQSALSGYTASFWIYLTNLSPSVLTNKVTIYTADTSNGTAAPVRTIVAGTTFQCAGSNIPPASVTMTAASSLSPNKWYFLTCSIDSNNKLTMYINGALATPSSGTNPTTCQMYNVFNRVAIAGGLGSFGYVDNATVYGKSMTIGEIQKMYAEGLPEHSLAFDK